MTKDVEISSSVAIYLRISSLEQLNNGFGRDLQLNKIKNLIQYRFNNGDTDFIFDAKLIYQDLAISGYKGNDERPGLEKLLRDIEKGKIKKVIVWRLDRLARKTKLLLEIIEFFDTHGIDFISSDENVDTKSPTGRFFLTILGAIGEMERSLIAEKTYLGKLEAAKKGQYPFGQPPYGFKKEKGEKVLVVDEEKKKIIKKIFEMYTNENKSLNEISKILYSQGVFKTNDGKKIGRLIGNTTYKGDLWVNTTKDTRDEKTGKRKHILKPKEEHILIKVEPFVSEKIFDKAQTKLIENRYLFNNKNKPVKNHYFAGLMECGECGSKFRAYMTHKGGIERIYYRCTKSHSGKYGNSKCSNSQLSEASIIGKIFEDIDKIIKNPEATEKKYLKQSDSTKHIKKYTEEINTIDKAIDKEYNLINQLYGNYDNEDDERIIKIIETKLKKSKSKISQLKDRISGLKGYIEIEELNKQNKSDLGEFSKKLNDLNLEDLNREQLRECFRIVIEKVVVYKTKVEIIYKYHGGDNKKIDPSSVERPNIIVETNLEVPPGVEPGYKALQASA